MATMQEFLEVTHDLIQDQTPAEAFGMIRGILIAIEGTATPAGASMAALLGIPPVPPEDLESVRQIRGVLDQVGENPQVRDTLMRAIQEDGTLLTALMESGPQGAASLVQRVVNQIPDNAQAMDFIQDVSVLAGESGEQIRAVLDDIAAQDDASPLDLRGAFMEAARQDNNLADIIAAPTDEARMTEVQELIADIEDPAAAFATLRAASTLIEGENGQVIRDVLDRLGADTEVRDAFINAVQQDSRFIPFLIEQAQTPADAEATMGAGAAATFNAENIDDLLANEKGRDLFIRLMNDVAGPQTPEEVADYAQRLLRAKELAEAGNWMGLINENLLGIAISEFMSGSQGATDGVFGEIGGIFSMLSDGHDNFFRQLLEGISGAEGMDPELQNGLMGVAQLLSGFLPMMFEGFGTMLAPFGTAISAIGRDAINERTMGPGTQVAAAAAPVVPDDDDDLPDVDSPSMVTPDPARTVVPVGP